VSGLWKVYCFVGNSFLNSTMALNSVAAMPKYVLYYSVFYIDFNFGPKEDIG